MRAMVVVIGAMGTYAVRADEDSLTGLFNRRGFIAALTRRLGDPHADDTHLTMVMIDLDAFKRINDTFGHAAGDRALIAVADVLRKHMASTAVLCRAGGEEFLIAATSPSPNAETISARLGAAIAALPQGLTASIGTATAELPLIGTSEIPGLIEKLIDVAEAPKPPGILPKTPRAHARPGEVLRRVADVREFPIKDAE